MVSIPSYVLPVTLALHLAGLHDPKVHQRARHIFEEVGLFAQVNRDYAGYFLEDNDFRDIREGRLTWMIAVARQRVSSRERKVRAPFFAYLFYVTYTKKIKLRILGTTLRPQNCGHAFFGSALQSPISHLVMFFCSVEEIP